MEYVNRNTGYTMQTPGDQELTGAEVEAGWVPVDIDATPSQRHRPHIVNGEFQSDKYPTTPPGKVPLSVKDPMAQDLLWEYAQRRRTVDAKFAEDVETCLRTAGYVPTGNPVPEFPPFHEDPMEAFGDGNAKRSPYALTPLDRPYVATAGAQTLTIAAPVPLDERGLDEMERQCRELTAASEAALPAALQFNAENGKRIESGARTVVGRLPRLAPVPPPARAREAAPSCPTLQELRAELTQVLRGLDPSDIAHVIVRRRLDYIDNAPPGRLDEAASCAVVSGMIEWARRGITPTPDRRPTQPIAAEVKPPSIRCHAGMRCTGWPECEFCGPARR